MGVLFTNNASTTLSAAISSTSATSISVASSSTFPSPGAGEYFYATIDDGTNIEIVKVTAVSGTTWTVVRASDNTSAATFANGTTIQLRAAAALLTDIQQNIAAKSANQTVYNATTASSATTYNVGTDPQNEANAMVFLDGVMQHHDTFSFSGSTLTFDAAPSNGLKLEVIIDNLINLQSSNLTVDTFTATNGQTAFTLSDTPAAEDNLIVFIEGVFQNQDSYSISTNTLTMSAGVTTNRKVVVYIINPVNIGTPSDGTVTSAKLSGNITTPGTLTVGSYDVAFDSPTFVVDNSNSRVGLGTASPSVPVDIVGDVKMSSTLDLTSHLDMPDNAKIKLGTGDDLEIYHDGSHNYIDAVTGDQDIIFKGTDSSSDITALTLDMSEAGDAYFNRNVGIGAAPTNGGISTAGSPVLSISGTVPELNFVDTSSSANDYWIRVSDGLQFGEASDSRMYLKNGGNLGIGNTTATTRLQITGTSNEEDVILLEDNSGTDVGALRIHSGAFIMKGKSSTAPVQMQTHDGNEDIEVDPDGFIKMETAGSERLRIDSSGKVGIGTTSPARDMVLVTEGSTNGFRIESADESLHFFGAGGSSGVGVDYGYYAQYSEGVLKNQIYAAGDSYFNGGNVGIGTTSPSSILHCEKALSSDTQSTPETILTLAAKYTSTGVDGAAGSGARLLFKIPDDSTNPQVGASIDGVKENGDDGISSTALVFSTSQNDATLDEAMRIDSTGGLLIGGTSNPGAVNLVVGGTGGTARILPMTDNVGYVGEGNYRWQALYAVNGSIQTSDEREKTEIKPTSLGLDFIKDLEPISYKWIDGEQQDKGKDEREHQGLIAQQVARTVEKHGIDKNKFGGLDIQKTDEYDDFHGMSYDQFVAPLIKAVQEQQEQIEQMKQEIEALKDG